MTRSSDLRDTDIPPPPAPWRRSLSWQPTRTQRIWRAYRDAALDGLTHAARYVSALTCAGVLIGLVLGGWVLAYRAGRMGL